MRLTIPLLINPNAGSLFRSGLKAWLDTHRDDFTLVPTKSAEDLTEKSRCAAVWAMRLPVRFLLLQAGHMFGIHKQDCAHLIVR